MTTSAALGTALITGASTGIGATYADRLARRGHDLILVARNAQQLEERAAVLRAETGVKVDVLAADLTSKADLHRVEQRLHDDASITLLLNNAGIATPGGLIDGDLDRVEQMILLNVLALTRLAGVAAAEFGARGRGTIINLASVVALLPESFSGTYSGTKAYVLNLTQAMQVELSPRGVRVQAVLPGATRTEIWERSGIDLSKFPASMVMDVNELVDAALRGLDLGEVVTIPSLPDTADWDAFTAARQNLGPNLSRDHAASRYAAAS